jgi:antitoxin component YwqK of YwqJK toxin-antitoxin module
MKKVIKTSKGEENPSPPKTFSGVWEVLWPNGIPKYRAEFENGKENGMAQCWWENGALAQEGRNEGGIPVGIWRDYFDDGSLSKETEYLSSSNIFFQKVYDENGKVYLRREFRDGVKFKEEYLDEV